MSRANLLSRTIITLTAALVLAPGARAQISWEGQSGVFLNPLAYPIAPGKVQASAHYIDLERVGTISTFSVAGGLRGNVEIGFTRIASGVTGVASQNVIPVKWQFVKETSKIPGVAANIIYRDLVGTGSITDYGLTGTKVLKAGTSTVIVSGGFRYTKALGVGLFGIADSARVRWEASAAIFVNPKLILGAEYKEQIGARAWRDIALRYLYSKNLTIDVGLANFAPSLSNQVAAGITWAW